MQREASNWTLGTRPIAHKSSVPQSVKNGQDSNLALWDKSRQTLSRLMLYVWDTKEYGNQCLSLVCFWVPMATDIILILITWMRSNHWLTYSCCFPQASWVNSCVPGQSLASQTQKRLKRCLVHFMTCDCKFKTDKIPVIQLWMFLLNAPLFVTL